MKVPIKFIKDYKSDAYSKNTNKETVTLLWKGLMNDNKH